MIAPQATLGTKIRKTISNKTFKKNAFVVGVLIIPIICFCLFWVYVHIDSLLLSFRKEVTAGNYVWTFDIIVDVFKDLFMNGSGSHNNPLGTALLNTLIFYAVGTVVMLPLSILMSYFIFKKIRFYKFFRVIIYLPGIISSSALFAIFLQTFDMGGPISTIVGFDNFVSPLNSTSGAMWLMILYNISFGFGGNIMIFGGAMNSINKQMLEAGEIDGCGWFKELTHLIIPSIWPTISTCLILGLVSILAASGPILVVYQYYSYKEISTLSFTLYAMVAGITPYYQDLNYAACLGLVMSIMTLPLVFVAKKFLMRESK